MKRKHLAWLSIATIVICSSFLIREERAEALLGEDIPFLIEIIAQAVQTVSSLTQIIGTTRDTLGVLQDMNSGVRDVLHLAETAHVPLPQQVYEQAKQIDQATATAGSIYGILPNTSPKFAQTHYRSGVEGLFLSQDAFEYSTFMDGQGRSIKDSAVVANQASATRLTAESMGVLVQGVDQTNRLQAKSLEITSTNRIEESTKENSRYESFIDTHTVIEADMVGSGFSSLPAFGTGGFP
jgi:hypothetical protein